MKPWSHLPNAQLIDWVLESVKNNPYMWRHEWAANWAANWAAARNAALLAARNSTSDGASDGALTAACDSILALIAYDDCQQYLDMSYEQLKVYALLSERPQAVLLLPLKWVRENETLVTPT